MSFIGGFVHKVFNPNLMFSRTRYYADKLSRGPLIKRYGYKDDIIHKGLLPRIDNGQKLPMPTYK